MNRARDWFAQAEKDLAHARLARENESHEWACFASQQAAEKAVKPEAPFVQRSATWPVERLPVPADLLVYTEAEWSRLTAADTRFARVLRDEVVWLWPE